MARLNMGAHVLALGCIPVCLLGVLALSRRLAFADPPVMLALTTYALGSVAAMNAAVLSGLVAPILVREIVSAGPTANAGWRIALNYSGQLNQAFALVYVVASSVAIALWSTSILRSRAMSLGTGICGYIVALGTLIAVLSCHLRLDVHGFGLIVLGQAIWFIIVGAQLCRVRDSVGGSV